MDVQIPATRPSGPTGYVPFVPMASPPLIIRVQSSDGTKRVEVKPTDTTKALYEKVFELYALPSHDFALTTGRDLKSEIASSSRKTVKGYKLNHGDMLHLHKLDSEGKSSSSTKSKVSEVFGHPVSKSSKDKEQLPSSSKNLPSTSKDYPSTSKDYPSTSKDTSKANSFPASSQVASRIKSLVEEDEVDRILAKEDGRIPRKQNPQLCRHGATNKCVHCIPLDPWDENYLKEQNIKHLSFNSYLGKLSSGVDKGKFVSLDDINCRIKAGCKDHPPWPKGICSKCQPSAITLNRQSYRHVDNVMFENPNLVERFLNYWRVTGHQRLGFLYGRYESHLDVPLGIKATVVAVYEPPQEGTRDHVKLLPDTRKELVDEIAKGMGLTCVGWIFTDLVPLDANNGTVRHLRHAGTFFLSAHEVITAAHLQYLHPNPCRLSPEGRFGSKFVTVHMEGYQVSNQCQSVVRDKCLIPTKDAPELAYIKESTAKQYVPDVYFKEKDQYNNEVVRLGRPLPVEYLLLDCPVSTPNEPLYTFAVNEASFPVANRMVEGHLQDFTTLAAYLKKFKDDQFLEAMSDLHVLIYIAAMDMLPLREYIGPLLDAVKSHNRAAALEWKQSGHWATVEQLVMASGAESLPGGSGTDVAGAGPSTQPSAAVASWTCQHCTFINQTATESCDMCHLPK
ncbi:Nuclear protein localization protein 4 [Chionoecetes opilio]|uniref:Nuclear protein localization protein 4 n=1 Tax=Chionoecetes opilio TaxID=41210 RepID=A0A8J5CYQ1_CHIOP|nr:Nuclear protein localization protein 4 [Chionoecetes opilio]